MKHTPRYETTPENGRGEDAVLAETLEALRMPASGLRVWLEQNSAFCRRHGGRRRYAELMDLYDACLAALGRRVK